MGARNANPVNKARENMRAIERACQKFRDRLVAELNANPEMHGSIAVTVQLTGGVVDRFRATVEESEKCGLQPA